MHAVEKSSNHSLSFCIENRQIANSQRSGISSEIIIPKSKIIQTVALKSLKELAASWLLIGITSPFIDKVFIPVFLMQSIKLIAFEALVTMGLGLYIASKFSLTPSEETQNFLKKENLKFKITLIGTFDILNCFGLWNYPVFFPMTYLRTIGVLFHEMGHALAGFLLVKCEQILININLEGGYTEFRWGIIRKWAECLGEIRIESIVAVAGPVFDILHSILLLGIAQKIKEKYPDFSHYLRMASMIKVITCALYAFSALKIPIDSPDWGHDFFFLWKKAKINPIAAIITIIAIPLIFQCILWKIESNRTQGS